MSLATAPGTGKPSERSIPPNQTLYIKNLNQKIKKEGTAPLPSQTYPNFRSPLSIVLSFRHLWYTPLLMMSLNLGPVLDVICMKANGMRGQAHVVFRDVVTATTAMRALQNFMFLDQEMVRISDILDWD
jgi:U2 small nuclear ribonucleoprotein B''